VLEDTLTNTEPREHRPRPTRPDGSIVMQNRPSGTVGRATQQNIRHGCEKAFYVSPFLSRDCRYQFRVTPPDERVAVVIREEEASAPILHASFAGRRRRLSDGALLKMLLSYPLMTLKVVVAIHFEAVRLMLKGVKRHPHVAKAEYQIKAAE